MAIETEIRLRTDTFKSDSDRAEQELKKLKANIERMEIRLNVVFNDKEVKARFDTLLNDLQKRADGKSIVVPVKFGDATGGRTGAAAGAAAGVDGGLLEAAAGAAGATAAGRAGSLQGAMAGVGRVTAAYAIIRGLTATIEYTTSRIAQHEARKAGDLEKELELQEELAQKLRAFPVAGQLGGALNRVWNFQDQRAIDETNRQVAAQEKITDIMERRNELMRKSIDHAKELTRQAEIEAAERARPGAGAVAKAHGALTEFDRDLANRTHATGRKATAEELAARGALAGSVSDAALALSRKEVQQGAEDLAKWRQEVVKWNEEIQKAIDAETKRRNNLEDIRSNAGFMRMRAQGIDTERAQLIAGFDRRIRDERDPATRYEISQEKQAALMEDTARRNREKIEAHWENVTNHWIDAADAADAAADRILDLQSMGSTAQELELRNRGKGNVADFVGIRQRVRDIFAGAGDDPEKQAMARRIGIGMLDQFMKPEGGRGGMFGGGMDFGRSTQMAILAGGGKDRAQAIEFARAFSEQLKRGDNPLGEAGKEIKAAAANLMDAAKNLQPIGVIRR